MLHLFTKYLFIVYFLIEIKIITANDQNVNDIACVIQQTCSQCLKTPYCVWCSNPRFNYNNVSLTRCINKINYESKTDEWCSSKYVVLGNSFMNILKDKPLSRGSKDPVQVKPQKIKIVLRLGEEQIIQLNYSKAQDYPVDLYYLMDLSYSMTEYKSKLTKLGDKLAESMKKLTSNFRIGFGSFIDKVIFPMNLTLDKMPSFSEQQKGPYGFRNNMPLTNDLHFFKERVKDADLYGNYDTPEGSFDGIMQTLACIKEIGWREKARHILVVCTDAEPHIAGDGKSAGIIEPNDELCHLDGGYYNYSILQDYPSISQIDRKVKENNVNIIFSVPEKVYTDYVQLSKSITGSSIGILQNNAENVVSLINKEYEKLVDSVVITDNTPKIISVKYFTKCLNNNLPYPLERNECNGIRYGDVVSFQIVLKAIVCPENPKEWYQTIKIGPRDLAENLELEVELICNCKDCENSKHQNNTKSSDCKNNGVLDCGLCKCDDGFYGKQCECKGNEYLDNLHNFEECKMNNESEICSGRGICKCGICDCEKRLNPQEEFYGTYCECDNFSCNRRDGLVCGGRGKCDCGTCNCLPGWTGETCDCKESNSTCMSSLDSHVVCSGQGDCVCGACHCHGTENFRYSGQFCEECPTCPDKYCNDLKDCVECLVYKSGPMWQNNRCNDSCYQNILDVITVNHIEESDEKTKINNSKVCRLPIDGRCSFLFQYELVINITKLENEKYFIIRAQKDKDCPIPINVIGVSVGVIIATVILGLFILMLWKIYAVIQDKIEYTKFEKQKALVRWGRTGNPLYKSAITTVNNPTFNSQN